MDKVDQRQWQHESYDGRVKVSLRSSSRRDDTRNKLAAQTAHLTKPVLSVATSKGQRVIIDGVEFQFEQDGRKLIRVDGECI